MVERPSWTCAGDLAGYGTWVDLAKSRQHRTTAMNAAVRISHWGAAIADLNESWDLRESRQWQ